MKLLTTCHPILAALLLSVADSFAQTDPHSLTKLWRAWAPRDEIAPSFSVDPQGGRSRGPALKLETRDASSFGAWRREMGGIEGGKDYRFVAWYRAQDVRDERRSVIARLQWLDARGNNVQPPEFAIDVAHESGWTRVEYFTAAPTNARSVDLQLA